MKFRMTYVVLILGAVFASCARSPENFYFGDYSEAEHLYNRGEYRKAIQKYQSYVDENPEGHMAVISKYYIAKSHAALGDFEEAKTIFHEIVNQNSDLVWANFAQTQLQELEKISAAKS